MIGQHLILRCTKGCYDSTAIAGLKTAAVSENVSSFPSPRQQELNKVISEHAAFPDVSVRSGSEDNRGVLRLFGYRGVLMAMRTFRVHDLCDTGGSVSFTHTYMIADDNTGEDRKYILDHPESLSTLSCFDDYKSVAERTEGGLKSGNPVKVNSSLKMPDRDLPKFDGGVFERCGIDRETFATIIAAICHHVSTKGWIGLMTPNITEQTWDAQGGSYEGEQIITGIMALLPDCITRFFSAVSYWNDNPVSDVVKDYQLRILSGKFTENLIDKDISLFDLQHGQINTEVQPGAFGRYLWDIKDNPEEIEKFHNSITMAFGKNVDKIAKLPSLMDALTELHKMISGQQIDEQATLAEFLVSIGLSLPAFPTIYKSTAMLIMGMKDRQEPCSDKLESVIMTLLKKPDVQKLKVCYENLISLLMISINAGTAKEKTISMIAEQLDNRDIDDYRDQFGKYLEELKADENAKPSYSMLSLLIEAQDIPMLHTQKDDIMAIIAKCYQNALDSQDYELCAKMTTKQLRRDEPADNVAQICKRVVELTDYVSPETSSELIAAIGDQMDRFEQYDDSILSMGKAIFGLEEECDIAAYPDFFPLFMKLLRHGIIADREYIDNVWMKQYIFVVQNTNGDEYLFPEMFLGDPSLEAFSESMYLVELGRLDSNVGYLSSWEGIDAIISGDLENNPVKAFENVQSIMDHNPPENKEQLLAEIAGTVKMYALFLALYTPNSDRADYLLDYLMQDMNAFDMLIEAAETYGFVGKLPDAYIYLWTNVYAAFANDPTMIENCWLGILDTESKIIEKPYCEEIMAHYADYFKVVFEDITKIPEIKEDYIALLYRGVIDYKWDKALGLDDQAVDIVEMCSLIDNGTTEYTVDYFIDKITRYVRSGRGPLAPDVENLTLCTKRINRYLNNQRRHIMEDRTYVDRDRITVLSLARMYVHKHDESHSLYYLKGICEGDDHWIASLYVMFALKYLYVIENEESEYISDFLDTLRKIILNSSGAGRNTLLSAESQDAYHSYIQPHLYQDQQKPIFTAARSTGNPDLIAMFEIHVTKERPKGSGGLFGKFKR